MCKVLVQGYGVKAVISNRLIKLGRLKERVDKLDRIMENLTLGLEAEANSLVSNYLRQRALTSRPAQYTWTRRMSSTFTGLMGR